MPTIELTTIDADDRETSVTASVHDGAVLLDSHALAVATGWALKPEGLCRDDTCIPTRGREDLIVEGGGDGSADAPHGLVDLARFAALTHEPLVIDTAARLAVYGTSAATRADRLHSLDAPAFAVQDLAGETVELADFRGRKKLLVAFASW